MQEKKKKIVYTYGVFDLFHGGHVELLAEARELGDELVVGLFTDEVAKGFKREPIISFKDRKTVLENIKYVSKVIVQDTLLPDKNIKELKPDILAKGPGAGWGEGEKIPGEDVIREVGGELIQLGYHPGISTSEIIKKIQNL